LSFLESGKAFGKYRIVRVIGRGGMGVVYLAEDETLARQVALKVLDRAVTSGEDFERRFRQEARTIAGLRHPQIVRIHALEKVGDDLAIDMEFFETGSLADLARKNVATVGEVVRYMRDVLEALACCHEAGIIHRDVKPSNILLSEDGRALLSDFGLAKLAAWRERSSVKSASSSSLFVGTPRYAPPEAWDAQEPTPAWDVYSAGAVLFEAVASKTPYDAETPLALMKQMVERPVPPLVEVAPHASPELGELVGRMLERDPTKRISNAAEALEQLAHTPEAQEELSPDARTVVRKRRVYSRRRIHWAIAPGHLRRGLFATAIAVAVLILTASIVGLSRYPLKGPSTSQEGVTPRSGAADAYWIMDIVDPSTQATSANSWLMRPGRKPSEWNALAFAPASVWSVRATVGKGDAVGLEGNWAEYTDESARVFRHGTVSGTGRLFAAEGNLTVVLTFRCAQDASTWERSLVLKRAAEPWTDIEFMRQMESAKFVQPLLYRELLPRGVAWVESVESEWVAAGDSRVVVPYASPAAGGIQVDGRMDEAEWRTITPDGKGTAGSAPGKPDGSGAMMLLRYGDEGLYFGIQARKLLKNPRLTVVLMSHFNVPVAQSPRWSVQIDQGRVVVQRYLTRNGQEPWECQWQVAGGATEDAWETEVLIPYTNLGERSVPKAETRWRMNCTIVEGQAAESRPVARWGSENTDEAQQGMLLVFGPR
jgi:serine/threonine protein kinase